MTTTTTRTLATKPPVLNQCEPNPCMNTGTCITFTNGIFYSCFCQYGYSGKFCEIRPTTSKIISGEKKLNLFKSSEKILFINSLSISDNQRTHNVSSSKNHSGNILPTESMLQRRGVPLQRLHLPVRLRGQLLRNCAK